MNEHCIGFGKFRKIHLYILSFIIFSSLKNFVLYYSNILNNIYLMQSISRYFSFLFFGIIFYIKFKKNLNNSKNKNFISNKYIKKNNAKEIKLIYNNNDKIISYEEKILYYIICFIYVLYYEILQILDFFELYPLDIWSFESIFVILFMHLYYPHNTYNHQIYSMIFIAVINTILLISVSFFKNYEDNTKNIYEYKGKILCTFGIIINIDISFFIYFARIKVKEIMDNLYISPYKIIILIGIIGFISEIILSLIFRLLDVSKKCNGDNNNNNIYCYFKMNIRDYFSELFKINTFLDVFKEIILILLFIISFFMRIMSELFIIKYLNPSYILISYNIYFEILKLNEYFPNEKDKQSTLKFIFVQFTQLFEFIGCLIYLEIIELRFCGLNKNLKKNISKRSDMDVSDEMILDPDISFNSNSQNNTSLIEMQ